MWRSTKVQTPEGWPNNFRIWTPNIRKLSNSSSEMESSFPVIMSRIFQITSIYPPRVRLARKVNLGRTNCTKSNMISQKWATSQARRTTSQWTKKFLKSSSQMKEHSPVISLVSLVPSQLGRKNNFQWLLGENSRVKILSKICIKILTANRINQMSD